MSDSYGQSIVIRASLEHAVFASVAEVHNRNNETFFDKPQEYDPRSVQKVDGGIDPRPWCCSFYAAMDLNPRAWKTLLNRGNINHGRLLPILAYCLDKKEAPALAIVEPEIKALHTPGRYDTQQ